MAPSLDSKTMTPVEANQELGAQPAESSRHPSSLDLCASPLILVKTVEGT